MNDRERLIELLNSAVVVETIRNSAGEPVTSYETSAVYKYRVKPLADLLIANGVTVQKHGRWVRNEWADYVKECSVCGKVPNAIPGRGNTPCYSKFCPNCGAKMDGEADEHN